MDAFPAFFPLKGQRLAIAGDGEAAAARARLFAGSPAEVVRIAAAEAVKASAWLGARLAFVAIGDAALAERAAGAARAAGALVNVFDRPALSDFHTPAIIDRGQVVAAIGTSGAAPLLAQLLRAEVEARVPEGTGAIASVLGDKRAQITAAFPDLVQRRAFMRAVLAGPEEDIAARLEAMIAAGFTAHGKVWLIEAPSAHDLISLRAQRALNFADMVVGPASMDGLITRHARRDAERGVEADASAVAVKVESGALVAVIAAPPSLAQALAALGITAETLRAAPA
ncbi:MAG TPA: NAD(P)-dependent oxidoreductase [Caulobacteraceae bacterium]|nr:NAD(P)-dependent oxidoreductase [Caulobacteraceae bacterium]